MKTEEIPKKIKEFIKDKNFVECHRCKYIWMTRSEAYLVSCPKCGTKVVLKLRTFKLNDEGRKQNGK